MRHTLPRTHSGDRQLPAPDPPGGAPSRHGAAGTCGGGGRKLALPPNPRLAEHLQYPLAVSSRSRLKANLPV